MDFLILRAICFLLSIVAAICNVFNTNIDEATENYKEHYEP